MDGQRMIAGIGLDLIETARVGRSIKHPGFLRKVYTPSEQQYISDRNQSAQTAAGIFAAKEAVSKALGTGFGYARWLDVEILQDDLGKPYAVLTGNALERMHAIGGKNVLISITHIRDLAAAQAVIDG
jgi:holo-[acyl-carrier-protein] synthase